MLFTCICKGQIVCIKLLRFIRARGDKIDELDNRLKQRLSKHVGFDPSTPFYFLKVFEDNNVVPLI